MRTPKLGWIVALLALFPAIVITVILPRQIVSGMRLPLQRSLADVGVTQFEEVEFSPPDASLTLRGWWLPAANARAAVIVVHGGGGNRSDPWLKIPELCRDLQARGLAVLAFDMRNHGTSDAAPDGLPGFGPLEGNDVIGAVNFIQARAPQLEIAALGFSMGGNAVVYAASRDRRIHSVITTGTYAEASSVLPAAIRAGSGLPEWLCRLVLWNLESFWGVPISRVRAVSAVAGLEPGALLIIHNEADPIVPLGHAWLLATAADDADLWIVDVPPAGDPLYAEVGAFGTHVKEYRIHPREYVDKVVAHIQRIGHTNPTEPEVIAQGQGEAGTTAP